MPARTGAEFLRGLREAQAEVWIRGERVDDVTSHKSLQGCARSLASLYDMQHDPRLESEMTYKSPTTEDPVGLSFVVPRSTQDLEKRRAMMTNWAQSQLRDDG